MNYALSHAQEVWDRMGPPDFDEPASMQTLLELQKENFELREQLVRGAEIGRDLGESSNRVRCCLGNKMLAWCNEVEGIPAEQEELQEDYEG